ncbi:hypothetical protein [Geothrix sp.]|jgi:hypothetical protein|uniref:DUF6982 domain-containing protein n=1 Tax=Geothrix sp. TaxID=1962974 RepID=UPI0025C08EAF|nr:hypothetical protein [Geothrix sp.]
MNQVVARFLDGTTLKGQTSDFLPTKNLFHILLAGTGHGAKPQEVKVPDLKAVYFVRRLEGDPDHHKTNDFPPFAPTPGRKVQVTFKDGEVLVGTTQGYQPDRPGFFLLPADPRSNNERCFIVTTATQSVAFL